LLDGGRGADWEKGRTFRREDDLAKAIMAPEDDRHDSAPDLRILGDRITLQPSGFVEPALTEDGKEEALMKNMARFRSEPLR